MRDAAKPPRARDPITLLATGEHVQVMVAGKNHFTVTGHVLPCYVRDEGVTWARGHVGKDGT